MCSVITANCVRERSNDQFECILNIVCCSEDRVEIIEVLDVSISDRTFGAFWTTSNQATVRRQNSSYCSVAS